MWEVGSMKGEPQRRPSAGDGQSSGSFPNLSGSPYRGRHDRKALASAERNYERYSALAREASSRGDMVAMENFYQHADHYFRMMRAASDE